MVHGVSQQFLTIFPSSPYHMACQSRAGMPFIQVWRENRGGPEEPASISPPRFHCIFLVKFSEVSNNPQSQHVQRGLGGELFEGLAVRGE